MSRIIILNGCSSSGKSSLAKAIQDIDNRPWLHTGLDWFIEMMPHKFMKQEERGEEGFFYFVREIDEEGEKVVRVKNGLLGDKVWLLMSKFILMLANTGLDIIIDEVLLEDRLLKTYVKELAPSEHTIYFIKVHCDIEVAKKREALRGDREIGLAKGSINRVHGPTRKYDLEIDASYIDPITAGQKVLDFVSSNPRLDGFSWLYEKFGLAS